MNKELILFDSFELRALDKVNKLFKVGNLVRVEWAIPGWNDRSDLKLNPCIYLGAKFVEYVEVQLHSSRGFVTTSLTSDIKLIKLN